MKKCLVIGGGIAGLTASSILSSQKISVTLIEATPKLGGRTYSFTDKETSTIIDNGQHILMGCYKETLLYLKLIRAENNFDFQKNLKINFLSRDRKEYKLNADKLFYPFNLLYAILNYDAFTLGEKLSFIGFVLKLPFQSKKSLKNISILDWLERNNQNENLIKYFWEILCVGALNSSLTKASAQIFHNILTKIFFNGNFASTIVLPKFGLSESLIEPAEKFIIKNGGKITCSESVKELVINSEKITEVKTDKTSYRDFDFIVSAVPLFSLGKFIDPKQIGINLNLTYSTILNIHLWIEDLDLDEKFYGFFNSPLHWIFVKDNHFNIVISDADYLAEESKEYIYNFVINELRQFIEIDLNKIKHFKIIKEKRATFIPTNEVLDKRASSKTMIKNLFLAGDWINTGLPSTIESAVKSGRMAAELVLQNC